MQLNLFPLFKVLFYEITPGQVKYAADRIGFMNLRIRLPLTTPLGEANVKIDRVLEDLEIFPKDQKEILKHLHVLNLMSIYSLITREYIPFFPFFNSF